MRGGLWAGRPSIARLMRRSPLAAVEDSPRAGRRAIEQRTSVGESRPLERE